MPTLTLALWGPSMRHSSRRLGCVFLLFVAGDPALAGACGLCREDDLAGVYTYEAQQLVQANPDAFAFVLVKLEGALNPGVVGRLQTWLRRVRGIEAATVRVSLQQRVAGFVMQKRGSPSQLVHRLSKTFPALQFRLLPEQGAFR